MDIYLNGKIITTKSHPGLTVIFNRGLDVSDHTRGYLVYEVSNWNFKLPRLYKYGAKKLLKICLILESPHKSEYDLAYTPLRAAYGDTGFNIDRKIVTRQTLTKILNVDYDYEVIIVNPIQYQTSLHHELYQIGISNNTFRAGITPNQSLKNEVFRALFNKNKGNLREDFKQRVNNFHPDIIYSCCTASLSNIVKKAIIETGAIKILLFDKHPSVW